MNEIDILQKLILLNKPVLPLGVLLLSIGLMASVTLQLGIRAWRVQDRITVALCAAYLVAWLLNTPKRIDLGEPMLLGEVFRTVGTGLTLWISHRIVRRIEKDRGR